MDSAQFVQGILESLGWAILHSFWQMASLWLAFQLLFGTRSRVSPHVRHHAAVVAMLMGTCWFIATFVQQYTQYLDIERYLALVPDPQPVDRSMPASQITLSGIIQSLSAITAEHIAWLSAIYLCMLALMGWKILQGYLHVRTLRTKGLVAASPDLQRQVETLARRLSIQIPVQVYLSRLVDVPATLGMLKPVVLLPVSCVTQLSPAQLESILLHELAHIRRMDYLVNLVVGVMETLLLHNPFAWWFARCIRREREWCCDDIVLAQQQDAIEYAAALLSLEKQRRLPQAAMAMASNGQQGQLLQRIRRITSRPAARIAQPQRLMALGLILLLMLSMAWIGPTHLRAGTLDATTANREIARVILAQPPGDLTRPGGQTRIITETYIRNKKDPRKSPGEEPPDAAEVQIQVPPAPPAPPPVFVNEAPPESFTFYNYPAEADAVFIVPALPEMQPRVPGRVPETRQRRATVPDVRVPSQQELFSLRQQEALEQMIRAELERDQVMEAIGRTEAQKASGREKQAAPRKSAPHISPSQAPASVTIERIFQGQSLAPGVWQEFYRDNMPRDMLKRIQAPRDHSKETVKVTRIKTRDGYALRIITEKESIDVRIGEEDIIVEKD